MTDGPPISEPLSPAERQAAFELLPQVYEELRKLAACKMAKESPGHTLQPTALVHEAWLKLGAGQGTSFQNRAHFFSAAAEAMRRILIDNARHKEALRHGGGQQPFDLAESQIAAPERDEELLAVHEALDKLQAVDSLKAEVVKLRFFGGLTIEQTAEILGLSEPTVKRYWAYARAWLYREIRRL